MEHQNPYTILQIGELVRIEWTALVFVFLLFVITVFLFNKLLLAPVLKHHFSVSDKEEALRKRTEKVLSELERKNETFIETKKRQLSEMAALKEKSLKEARAVASDRLSQARRGVKEKLSTIEEAVIQEISEAKKSVALKPESKSAETTAADQYHVVKAEMKKLILEKMAQT